MKNFWLFTILLFLFFLPSCTNPKDFYSSAQYQYASDAVDQLRNPTVDDYYIKLKSLLELGKKDEAKESLAIFMLLSEDPVKREEVSHFFIEAGFSDELNVSLLRPDDSLESLITIYKSYINLKDFYNAKLMLNDHIKSKLSDSEFNTLIINYPVDSDYIITMLSIWQTTLTQDDKDTYLLLLSRFSKLEDLTESSCKVCVDITTRLENDEYYNTKPDKMTVLYTLKADILSELHDNYNSNIYRKLAQQMELLNER